MNYTIITITLNNASGLEKTIQSILSQSYEDIRHIIIDGNSKDNTHQIIEKYSPLYNVQSVSELDKGIYDAMNKGLDEIIGDKGYTLFLNSGDIFAASNVLNKLRSYLIQNYVKPGTFVYGDHIYLRKGQRKHVGGKDIEMILKGMPFSHQAIFIPNSYLQENKYSLLYKIAGDYDYFLAAWKKKSIFKYAPLIIAVVEGGGVSDMNRIKGIKERMYSLQNQGLLTGKLKGWYNIRIIRTYFLECIKKSIG